MSPSNDPPVIFAIIVGLAVGTRKAKARNSIDVPLIFLIRLASVVNLVPGRIFQGIAELNLYRNLVGSGRYGQWTPVQGVTQGNVLIEGYLGGREYRVGACELVISRKGVLERHDGPRFRLRRTRA